MELNRLKQRRVSFSDPPSQKEERLVRPIVEDGAVIGDDKHGTAAAAAALVIYSLEQAELLNLQKMKEGHVHSSTQTMRRKEESISRKPSCGLTFTGGSWKKSFREDHEGQFPVRLSSAGQSPISIARYQKHKESHTALQQNAVNSRAESWKMDKIQKRYEKLKFKILLWEGEKKMQAILQKDRTKDELEQKRAMAMQHYQNKIATINRIAQRARAKLENKKRKEESKVKEKAHKIIIKTGRLQVKCFCFKFLMCRK